MEKIKKLVAQISTKITSTTHVFGFLAIVVGALLLIYDIRYLLSFGGGWDYINNIIVEAHGLFFDLLVLGILISIYEHRRQKKEAIERDENLIFDFSGWNEKEAAIRISGAIRRLNKLGVSKIELSNCFLNRAGLSYANLQEATLMFANLERANFFEANLKKAIFRGANLQGAVLQGANLQGADFRGANLQGALLWGADLRGVDLRGAIVFKDWLKFEFIGIDEIKEKYVLDGERKLLLK